MLLLIIISLPLLFRPLYAITNLNFSERTQIICLPDSMLQLLHNYHKLVYGSVLNAQCLDRCVCRGLDALLLVDNFQPHLC